MIRARSKRLEAIRNLKDMKIMALSTFEG